MDRRMTGLRVAALMVAAVIAAAIPVEASLSGYGYVPGNPVRKLGRGLANFFAGAIEIPVSVSRVSQDEGPVAGFSVGLLYGVGAAVTRTVVGAAEILTFPFPLPDVGYGPIIQPEFLLNPMVSAPSLSAP